MKFRCLFISAICLATLGTLSDEPRKPPSKDAVLGAAQTAEQSKAELEKIGVPFYLQGDKLVEVPRVSAKKKGQGLIVTAREKIKMEIKGKTAELKIQNDLKPAFVIALPGKDPGHLALYPLKVKGDKREATVGSGGAFVGSSSRGAETFPVDFTRWGRDSYKVVPSQDLPPGEYGFSFAESTEFFCFSVQRQRSDAR